MPRRRKNSAKQLVNDSISVSPPRLTDIMPADGQGPVLLNGDSEDCHAAQTNPDGHCSVVCDTAKEAREQTCMQRCCVPTGCLREDDPIDANDLDDSVKVLCSNDACNECQWMHLDCFNHWEQSLLTYLRSCGRARSWSEKQRIQNLWSKKGYDLVFRACECRCGRGHIRKDLDYQPAFSKDPSGPAIIGDSGGMGKNRRRGKRRNDKPDVVLALQRTGPNTHHVSGESAGCAPPFHAVNGHYGNATHMTRRMRQRQPSSSSNASTGTFSSSLDEEMSPPLSPDFPPLEEEHNSHRGHWTGRRRSSCGNSLSTWYAAAADRGVNLAKGNIFHHRKDFSCFQSLPKDKQNSYYIQMEDDSCNGNDDTKCFVLTHLTSHRTVNVPCLVCASPMPVYDHFPLINGTFFVSPVSHDDSVGFSVAGPSDRTPKFLHAICMRCMETAHIACRACQRKWSGHQLVIGSMYSYDIFAAVPCCYQRLACKSCSKVAVATDNGTLKFFSQYSQRSECPHCHNNDYHFVRRFADIYTAKVGPPLG